MPIEVMPNRNPLDLECVHAETPRKNDAKAQENKGKHRGTTLRGRGPQTLQSSQVRDRPEGQEGLVPSLQFFLGETLTCHSRSHRNHALKVVQFAVVERERPLVHVARRVLGSVVRVGALPGALVERPEVLDAVRVHVPAHVLARSMVYRFVIVDCPKPDVRPSLVRVERCTGFNPRTNAGLNRPCRHRLNHRCHDWPTALQGAVNGDLVRVTRSVNLALAVGDLHALRESADVGFVRLHGARQLLKRPACHCQADPVVHEPRRLLSHAQSTTQFVRRDSVLGVGDQPNRREPFVEPKGRVFKNGSNLQRELTPATLALPDLARSQERGLVVIATGAHDRTVRPAQTLDEVKATVQIGEITNGFDARIGKVWSCVFHTLILPNGCDMYVSPLTRGLTYMSHPAVRGELVRKMG